MNYDLIYNNKEKLGKVFFSISLIVFIYMLLSPLTHTYIHIDEHYTINLLRLPFIDFFNEMASDVHPPLYYFISLFIGYIFNIINIAPDYLRITKIVSVISYGLLLLISATKIKNDYGWFEAGIFTFIIATMSGFLIQFLTSRMYGWALLLLVLSFIYLNDVMTKSDAKSWVLFVIFTMLCAYTHYFLVFTVGFMYLIIIGDIIKNKKFNEIKKVILAIISSIIIYIPEIYILSIQMSYSHGNGSSMKSLFDLISYISIGNYQSMSLNIMILKIITVLFLIGIIAFAIARYWYSHQKEEKYVLIGIILFLLTLFAGYFIFPTLFSPLTGKYLLPVIGIFWLSTSILLGRLENRKIFTLCLIIILLLSCVGIVYNAEQTTKLYDKGIGEANVLNELNNNDTVIIYHYGNVYHNFHNSLNNTTEYIIKPTITYDNNATPETNISKIIEDNPGKDVYIIKPVKTDKDEKFGKDIKSKTIYHNTYSFIKLEKKK